MSIGPGKKSGAWRIVGTKGLEHLGVQPVLQLDEGDLSISVLTKAGVTNLCGRWRDGERIDLARTDKDGRSYWQVAQFSRLLTARQNVLKLCFHLVVAGEDEQKQEFKKPLLVTFKKDAPREKLGRDQRKMTKQRPGHHQLARELS